MSARRMIEAVLAVGLVAIGSAAGAFPSVVSAAQLHDQVLNVTVTSSGVSLTAREAPLAEVLTAIGRQTGVKIVLSGDLETPVTDTLVDVPLDAAIQRLTRWHSVLLIYGEPGAVREENLGLTEVWVMSAAVGAAGPEGRPDPKEGAEAATKNLRQLATTDPSPAVRMTALQKLARQPGVDAVNELREAAIRDPEPPVRQAAIRALADIRSAEAGDALRVMLNDSDPNIRELASHVLARWQQRIR